MTIHNARYYSNLRHRRVPIAGVYNPLSRPVADLSVPHNMEDWSGPEPDGCGTAIPDALSRSNIHRPTQQSGPGSLFGGNQILIYSRIKHDGQSPDNTGDATKNNEGKHGEG